MVNMAVVKSSFVVKRFNMCAFVRVRTIFSDCSQFVTDLGVQACAMHESYYMLCKKFYYISLLYVGIRWRVLTVCVA
jgi:hypothetical protein